MKDHTLATYGNAANKEEDEWRIILPFYNVLVGFEQKALKAIYFGIRLKQEDICMIKKLTKGLGYKIEYYEMQPNFKKMEIDFIKSPS